MRILPIQGRGGHFGVFSVQFKSGAISPTLGDGPLGSGRRSNQKLQLELNTAADASFDCSMHPWKPTEEKRMVHYHHENH